MIFRRNVPTWLIDAGCYEAEIVQVEETTSVPNSTKTGEIPRALVTWRLDDGRKISQAVLAILWGNSLVVQLCEAASGSVPSQFDSDDLLRKRVIVEIAHTVKGDATYQNVVAAWPLSAWEHDETELIENEDADQVTW